MAPHVFAGFQAMMLRTWFNPALGQAPLEQRLLVEAGAAGAFV